MIARLMFAVVAFAARKGLVEARADEDSTAAPRVSVRRRALRTGVRGETYAYWYLRRHGYVLVARNYTLPGMKGELDMVGYDGQVLAFVEVKTRAAGDSTQPTPEDAVNVEKRRNLTRVAQQFLRARHAQSAPYRFDILAIETRPGSRPQVRLHKGAFGIDSR